MKKILLIFCPVIIHASFAFADNIAINHFVIKENPFAKDEVAIVATDSLGNIQENVNGVFNFTLNGFQDTLKFDKGTAFYRHKIEHSTPPFYMPNTKMTAVHTPFYITYTGITIS